MSHHIRPAEADDLPACLALDDSYITNMVWQVAESRAELVQAGDDGEQRTVTFRPSRLPRPRQVAGLATNAPHQIRANWQHTDYFAVATNGREDGEVVAYLNLHIEKRRNVAWLTALAVNADKRRQGIATALLDEAKQWARLAAVQSIIAELPTINYPAAHFLQTQGFRFCGYNDALDPAAVETMLFFVYPLG